MGLGGVASPVALLWSSFLHYQLTVVWAAEGRRRLRPALPGCVSHLCFY